MLLIVWHVGTTYFVFYLSYFIYSLFHISHRSFTVLFCLSPSTPLPLIYLLYFNDHLLTSIIFYKILITAKQNILDCLKNEKINLENMEIASKKELDKQFEMCEIDRQKKQKWLEDENSR